MGYNGIFKNKIFYFFENPKNLWEWGIATPNPPLPSALGYVPPPCVTTLVWVGNLWGTQL
jgi:hypothetical protein